MAIRWPSLNILRRSSQENPPSGGLNAKGVAKCIAIFDISNAIYRKRCKLAGKLILITDRKSYMSFRLVPKSVTMNDLKRRNGPYFALTYFTEFGSVRGALRKIGWQSHHCGQFTITMSSTVVYVCRGTARRPRYKYSITARWKFCSRFINSFVKRSRFSFLVILKYVCNIVVKCSSLLSHFLMSSCLTWMTRDSHFRN